MSGRRGLRVRVTVQSRDGEFGIPWGWSGFHGTRGGWACSIFLGEHCEKSPRQLSLHGRSPSSTTQLGAGRERRGCQAGWGAQALGRQPPFCPCPSPPDAQGGGRPSQPWGRAEIIGCLPGRGSCHPAPPERGTRGSCPRDDFQMWPLARRRWLLQPGKHHTALPGPLL